MSPKWVNRFRVKDRWVYQPSEESRLFGTQLRHRIYCRWKRPAFYFHLRQGGHVAAVHSHAAHKYFYKTDITDFFGSVRRSRVARCLKQWLAHEDALEAAQQSTVRRIDGSRVLPYGFVQSPLLASIALAESTLGGVLHRLSMTDGFTVSVYMDDILVSANDQSLLADAKRDIEAAAGPSRFELSPSKTAGPTAAVSAFNIDLRQASVTVSPLRLVAFLEAYATGSADQRSGIRGYVDSVNAGQASTAFPI
jgi:hypothetical protein